jgi:hypothetical protein
MTQSLSGQQQAAHGATPMGCQPHHFSELICVFNALAVRCCRFMYVQFRAARQTKKGKGPIEEGLDADGLTKEVFDMQPE